MRPLTDMQPELSPHEPLSTERDIFANFADFADGEPAGLDELFDLLAEGNGDGVGPAPRASRPEAGAWLTVQVSQDERGWRLTEARSLWPIGWLLIHSLLLERALDPRVESGTVQVLARLLAHSPEPGHAWVLAPAIRAFPIRTRAPPDLEEGELYQVDAAREPGGEPVLAPEGWQRVREQDARETLRYMWSLLLEAAEKRAGAPPLRTAS